MKFFSKLAKPNFASDNANLIPIQFRGPPPKACSALIINCSISSHCFVLFSRLCLITCDDIFMKKSAVFE
ncbi:hypothetical protein DERF_002075 [Dermatophagoides farinae]|uniref:Uncharacterized protein n=1 Tax=Dermatophagoides farinae TaxID=6954 RepID=A0A922IF08_DERFA|nr:hypothetical protein DERF_002075 [Dermatophagoides farinae]